MSIRIIAGEFGGRSIQAPTGKITHPMSERVRNSLFNIIGDQIDDAKVMDVFAGTGSLGLEAISRGAKSVTFVERDLIAAKILKENIKSLDVDNKTTVFQIGARTWMNKNQDDFYDIIFADPPYNDMQLSTVADLGMLLKPNGLMVLSYLGRSEMPTVYGVVVVDNRNYGTAALAFYRKK